MRNKWIPAFAGMTESVPLCLCERYSLLLSLRPLRLCERHVKFRATAGTMRNLSTGSVNKTCYLRFLLNLYLKIIPVIFSISTSPIRTIAVPYCKCLVACICVPAVAIT